MNIFKKVNLFFIILVFLMIPTIWLLFPQINSDSVPGWGSDPYFCSLVVDRVYNQIVLGLHPFQDKFWDIGIFYPAKRTLAFSDPFILQGYLVFLLKFFFNLNLYASINTIFVFFFLLNWAFSFLFFWEVIKNKISSLVGGWLWSFSLYHLTQSAHFQNTASFTIPMTLYFTFKIYSNKHLIYRIGFALSFFILSCTNLYNFIFTEIAVGIVCAYLLVSSKTIIMKKIFLIRMFSSIILAVVLSFPILYRYIEVRNIYPEFENARGVEEQYDMSARPRDYFTSLHNSTQYNWIIPKVYHFERTASPGLYTMLIVCIFIIMKLYRLFFQKIEPGKKFYLSMGLLIIAGFISSSLLINKDFFSFILKFIPGIQNLRAIGRIGILVVLAECLLVAILLRSILLKIQFSNKRKINIYYLILFTGIIFLQVSERLSEKFRGDKIKIDFEKQIASPINRFLFIQKQNHIQLPVLEIQTKSDFTEHINNYLLRAHIHSQPIVNGYSGYEPRLYGNLNTNSINYFLNCEYEIADKNSPFLQVGAVIVNKDLREFKKEELNCFEMHGLIHHISENNLTLFYGFGR